MKLKSHKSLSKQTVAEWWQHNHCWENVWSTVTNLMEYVSTSFQMICLEGKEMLLAYTEEREIVNFYHSLIMVMSITAYIHVTIYKYLIYAFI